MTKRTIDPKSWNAALDAAAKLLGKDGYTFVRRYMDHDSMTAKIEVLRGDANVKGDYDMATHCSADDMTAAAILSLKK